MTELIVALDCDIKKAKDIINKTESKVNFFKIGPVMFVKYGKEILDYLSSKNKKIFLDLKLHDIPNTVKKTVENITDLNVYSVSVHISGGTDMIKAAVEGGKDKIKIWGVSILTSIDHIQYSNIGFRYSLEHQVVHFSKLAKDSGAHGIVASPKELYYLKKKIKGLEFITPSIRLDNVAKDDQKRFVTPKEAFLLGADYIVVGRPITDSEDPGLVADKIISDLER